MSLTTEQQISAALTASRRPLITFHQRPSGDATAAALALALAWQQRGIKADLVCQDFALPGALRFLPGSDKIQNKLTSPRQLLISLDADKTAIEQFHYDVLGDKLRIYLTPKAGAFGPQDITATMTDWHYDLIVVLDSPDLESLGAVYTDNREFFFQRPILNIDHVPANEQFGQINAVDLTAGATCAVLTEVLLAWDKTTMTPDVATCLLTGIIDKTRSFKAGAMNPQTLQLSSQLMQFKARREEIVKHLYYSRSLATLKLWGLILTKLHEYVGGKIIVASVSRDDFAATGTTVDQLPEIIDELIVTVPGVDIIVLLHQTAAGMVGATVRSLGSFDALKVLTTFKPTGQRQHVQFTLPLDDLTAAEKQIVDTITTQYKPSF